MDNRPLLQIGFDGHYVVYLWERGGEIPPRHPTPTYGQRLNAAALQIFKKQYHTIAIITLTDEPIA